MNTDIEDLIIQCHQLMEANHYSVTWRKRLDEAFSLISDWFSKNGYSFITPEIADRFLLDSIGDISSKSKWEPRERLLFNAIDKLLTFEESSQFRLHRPRAKYDFPPPFNDWWDEYCTELIINRDNSENTIRKKKQTLFHVVAFLQEHGKSIDTFTSKDITAYLESLNCKQSHKYYISRLLAEFFTFLKEKDFIDPLLLNQIPRIPPSRERDLPTTYTPDEVRSIIKAVDRSSAIGKRNYLMLVLLVTYAWRIADVIGLKFSYLDWELNTITFRLQKTGTMTSFPLMPHVGNAILDYKQNGRPQTEEDTIIVSHIATNRGKPISDSNAASIVVKYMTIAGIDGFTGRKHGPHVFRHSVATNMLNNRESLTTIQSVLGHKSTETTKEYLSLDLLSLRNCAVDVPEIVNNPLF